MYINEYNSLHVKMKKKMFYSYQTEVTVVSKIVLIAILKILL